MTFVTRHASTSTGRHIAILSSLAAPLPAGEPWNLVPHSSHAWAMQAQEAVANNDLIRAKQLIEFAYWAADAAEVADATISLIRREEETDLEAKQERGVDAFAAILVGIDACNRLGDRICQGSLAQAAL